MGSGIHSDYSDRVGLISTQLVEHIYCLEPAEGLLVGKRAKVCDHFRYGSQLIIVSKGHISNYYLGDVPSDEEVAQVQEAAEKLGIHMENTRHAMQDSWFY
jgi:dipeptidyl-peptidase III